MAYFILIKRKGAKNWRGAYTTKKGLSLEKLRTIYKSKIKKPFVFKIINSIQLKNIMKKIVNQTKIKKFKNIKTGNKKRIRKKTRRTKIKRWR